MSPDLITRAVHKAAERVSFYEAAEGDYSRERVARHRAKAHLYRLLKRADARHVPIDLSGYLLTGRPCAVHKNAAHSAHLTKPDQNAWGKPVAAGRR